MDTPQATETTAPDTATDKPVKPRAYLWTPETRPVSPGRPVGSRAKIAEQVIKAMHQVMSSRDMPKELFKLMDSDDASDRRVFWTLVQKMLPQQLELSVAKSLEQLIIESHKRQAPAPPIIDIPSSSATDE